MKKLLVISAFALMFPSFASTQVLIVGSKIGADCYQAALISHSYAPSDERVCTDAIKSETISRRDLAATHVNRGIIRMRKAQYDAAVEDYDEAARLRPKLGAIYLNKGAALISAGRLTEAIETLLYSIELETHDIHAAHYNLGLAHEANGDVEAAYYAFQKALELKPDWELAAQQLERFSVVSTG